jgi:hypothetical protein
MRARGLVFTLALVGLSLPGASAFAQTAVVRTESSPNEPLIFAGTLSLGMSYGASAVFIGLPVALYNLASGSDTTRNYEYLMIPFAGPFLTHQNQPSFSAKWAWILGGGQIAGGAFILSSFLFRQSIALPERPGPTTPEVAIGPGSASVRWRF